MLRSSYFFFFRGLPTRLYIIISKEINVFKGREKYKAKDLNKKVEMGERMNYNKTEHMVVFRLK